MADTKISAMAPAVTPLTGTELVPLVQSGVNVQTPISTYNDFVRASYFNYGGFSSNVDQTGSITAGTAMTFNNVDITDGVTLASGSRLTVPVNGTYNIQFSAQFKNLENTQEIVTVWFRVNGTDITNSATNITIPSRKNAFIDGYGVAAWNIFLDLTAGQYVEIIWLPAVATMTLETLPATALHPAIPSVIATVNQVG
jgi:hypothetical protein